MKSTIPTVILAVFIQSSISHAESSLTKYDIAVGQVNAAFDISEKCKGIERLGGNDYQQFVFQAADILNAQGMRKNKVRKILFYGKTEYLKKMSAVALKDRGVSLNQTNRLCSLARAIAGTEDAIGRFLKSP